MQRSDVVEYLRQNLSKFRVEDLRRQLRAEGVPDEDIEDSLDAALKASKGRPAARGGAAGLALAAGALMIGGVLLFALTQTPAGESAGKPKPAGESGYIGHRGWVVRMPPGYSGTAAFKDPATKTHEIVHFAQEGTDPTNFINEGLFGQMGIVRVEVLPSPFPPNPNGLAALTSAVSRRTTANGDKFVLKNMVVAGLSGVQINVQSPFPRVEAYLIGKRDLYFFYGGQDDDVWRDIVLSLRDMKAQE